MSKDNMVDHVVSEFNSYSNDLKERFDKAEKYYDHWKNKAPHRSADWQNRVHVPLTIEAEQTITPRIFTALFPSDAPLDVHVAGDADPQQGIRIKEALRHYFMVADVQGEAQKMLRQMTLFGTGYMETGTWYIKKGWQIDKNGDRYYTTLESRPNAEHVNFFELYPNPSKKTVKDSLPVIRRRFIDADYIKRLEENPIIEATDIQEALQTECPVAPNNQSKPWGRKRGDSYEMLEYWGPWGSGDYEKGRTSSGRLMPYWITVINRKVVIRGIPNPYNHQSPPYIKTIMFEDAKPNWFGVGIGEVGYSSQERCNKIVNQRLDNVDLVLNKQGTYNGNDPLINPRKLGISQPGKWHKVSDTVNSLKPFEFNDVTQSAYEEEAAVKQDYREATGATAHLMPEQGKQHRTAMGIQLLQGAAGMRFRPILRKMETDFLQQTALFFFSNLKQFMTDAEWIMVSGENKSERAIQLTPEMINAKVFFVPTGISETMNKETQVGQLLRFKEVTANDPTVNRTEINRRIAELMGFKKIDKMLVPVKPVAGPGELDPELQQKIRQRISEGAEPGLVKQEILGAPPIVPVGEGAERQ